MKITKQVESSKTCKIFIPLPCKRVRRAYSAGFLIVSWKIYECQWFAVRSGIPNRRNCLHVVFTIIWMLPDKAKNAIHVRSESGSKENDYNCTVKVLFYRSRCLTMFECVNVWITAIVLENRIKNDDVQDALGRIKCSETSPNRRKNVLLTVMTYARENTVKFAVFIFACSSGNITVTGEMINFNTYTSLWNGLKKKTG